MHIKIKVFKGYLNLANYNFNYTPEDSKFNPRQSTRYEKVVDRNVKELMFESMYYSSRFGSGGKNTFTECEWP